MNDSYSHVILLEVPVYDCELRISPSWLLTNHRVSLAVCASTLSHQTKYSMRLTRCLYIAIYVAVVHVIKYSLAQELVSTSSLWLVTYVPSSHIGRVPQCRVNDEFTGHRAGSLLGSLVPFSVHRTIIITNALLNKQEVIT